MAFFNKLFGKQGIMIGAPVEGRCVDLKEVSDPTFSDEILGKGIAVKPSKGKVVAPADGTVTTLFHTKHALSIAADNGAEILIHIGLDTVKLNGQFFEAHVEEGTAVKAGDVLIEFEIDKIQEAGYDVITPMIICNTADYKEVQMFTAQDVQELTNVLKLVK